MTAHDTSLPPFWDALCTQDYKSWKEIGERWGHRGAMQFQIICNQPLIGTEIRSQNDDLATLLFSAEVPNGPFRTCLVTTEAVAAPLHPLHVAPAKPELATYLRRNADQIIDYGERHRAGERISTGFVESAINQIVAKRFSKRQSMRWTQPGAHLLLQTRTRVLNGERGDVFRRRWPAFQPSRQAEAMAENCSFA